MKSIRRCRSGTSTCPPARCTDRTQAYTVQATGQLFNAASFRKIVVAWRNGTPVRLEQVANVIDSVEDDKNASMYYDKNGSRKAINLMVMKQPGANTIETNDEIKRLLPVDPGAAAAVGAS